MIIRSKLTKGEIESIKIDDQLDLHISNANNNNQVTKLKIKVLSYIKDKERCAGCTCFNENLIEFMKKNWCESCLIREKERRSKMHMSHPVSKNAFGGNVSKMKNKFE